MKNILIVIVLTLILMTGCSKKENPVSSLNSSINGNIVLKIDRINAPSNVVYVTAQLTRENFDPITGTMNLLSDTTAGITFTSIPVGTWHLKIDALNNNNQVVYTGETDVEVLDNILTQVNLTLQPTSTGVGGIIINVIWGTNTNVPFLLSDYTNNPILQGSNTLWDPFGVRHPVVLYESDSSYKMWFTGRGSNAVAHIGYAISNDGFVWTRHNSPVISPGSINSWDSHNVTPGAVIKENNEYMLFYSGSNSSNSQCHIGLATSTDGINWVKQNLPVLYASSSIEYQIIPSAIIKHLNMFYLYYTAITTTTNYSIRLATSIDGINWTRHPINPVIQANNSGWEAGGIYSPSVIKDGNNFKMIYMNKNSKNFGYAISNDGLNWQKQNSPIFSVSNTSNNWAFGSIMYPNLVKIQNHYRVYYAGMGVNSINNKIGVALK